MSDDKNDKFLERLADDLDYIRTRTDENTKEVAALLVRNEADKHLQNPYWTF